MPADPLVLRENLVAQLHTRLGLDEPVAAALRAVPRHVFLPGSPLDEVYRDTVIVTKRDPEGRPISSSSQPAIMAIMLDQLAVAPGHRVLEIGTGTGYNAALLAHLAGPSGQVTTVDIDPDLTARASTHLAAAGCPGVRVVCADGSVGFAPRAPYDRIIATVGVWDLAPAWLAQLAPTGRIVVPLDLRGVQRSIAFERAGTRWASRSAKPCGFMRMRGPFAGPEQLLVLDPETEHLLTVPHDRPVDLDTIRTALEQTPTEHPTTVTATAEEVFDGLNLWLAVHDSRWCTLISTSDSPKPAVPVRVPQSPGAVGILDAGSLAVLARPAYPRRPDELATFGYGPDGPRLAADLAAHTHAWHAAGHPGSDNLRIHAYPRSAAPDRIGDGIVIEKTHTRLTVSWSA